MKKIKFIICGLLVICGFFLSSEEFQDYLRAFENSNDWATMYAPLEVDSQEMLSDLLQAANENNISFFVSEDTNSSTFAAQKTIYYSSNEVISYIQDTYDVSERSYRSILCGKTDVIFKDIHEIRDLTTYDCFWLVGERNNQKQFKRGLIGKYGGSVPREGVSSDGTIRSCIKIWILLLAVSLMFSLYQIVSNKKEALVRIVYGESLGVYICKNIVCDTFLYICSFGAAYFIMSGICYTGFCFRAVLFLFLGMLLINALLYLNMLKFNLKRDLSRSKRNKQSLVLSYALKLLISVLTISIFTLNGSVVFEGLDFYSQKDFFKSKADYSYVKNKIKFSEPTEENDLINAKYKYSLYQHFTGEGKALMQVYLGDVKQDKHSYPIVYINKNNLPYLLECLPELRAESFSEQKVYYLFPQNVYQSDSFDSILRDTDDWVRWNLEMHYKYEYEYSVLDYQKNAKMIALSNRFELHSGYITNPIIAYNNRDESKDSYEITSDIRDIYDRDVMYKATENEIVELEQQSGYKPEKFILEIHNVYDEFQNNMVFMKRIIYINAVISILVIILNIIMTAFIVSMEYSINKIELAVKKTVGYSRFERFKKLCFVSAVTTMTGTAVFLCINAAVSVTQFSIILLCGLLILILDLTVISVFTWKADKDQIHKILKGG